MDFSFLKGKKISVLIVGLNGKKESYNDVLEKVEDDYLFIRTHFNPSNPTFPVDLFIIKSDIIESVWVYKDDA